MDDMAAKFTISLMGSGPWALWCGCAASVSMTGSYSSDFNKIVPQLVELLASAVEAP